MGKREWYPLKNNWHNCNWHTRLRFVSSKKQSDNDIRHHETDCSGYVETQMRHKMSQKPAFFGSFWPWKAAKTLFPMLFWWYSKQLFSQPKHLNSQPSGLICQPKHLAAQPKGINSQPKQLFINTGRVYINRGAVYIDAGAVYKHRTTCRNCR